MLFWGHYLFPRQGFSSLFCSQIKGIVTRSAEMMIRHIAEILHELSVGMLI